VQQINKNFFQLFDIAETFEVDQESLAEKYRGLQNEIHPDRFADGSESEKLKAVQLSSYLNEAYGTLRSPLKRAAYLLSLHDLNVEQVDQAELGMDLLMEQMQLREFLEELPRDESALAELESLKSEVLRKLEQRQQSFSSHLEKSDLIAAKKCFHEMQFFNKLLKEIESGEEQRMGY
jgi:molecular chaperone HscB|tara:strand:- start:92 stop:625 length:534 start_codon:yes stop_codon:yes gene_type:complete